MHPSAEIVSSLFLFMEKTRQHMQGMWTKAERGVGKQVFLRTSFKDDP